MKLYEIESAILDCIDPETGEIIDEQRLDALHMEREKKIEGILLWIKNLNADVEAFKAEEKTLAERRKVAQNKAERLTEYVKAVLNGERFSTPRVAVSYRKSEAVVVDDMREMMFAADDYLKFSDPEPDKTKIKLALKRGVNIPGCHLEERHNMTIK
jgi:hypothetical protein